MADKEFQIAIQTTADTSGTQQAQDALSRVTTDAETAAKTIDKTEQAVESLDKKHEIEIDIKTDADTSGTEKAKEALTQLAQEVERTVRIIDANNPRLGPLLEDGSFSRPKWETSIATDWAAVRKANEEAAAFMRQQTEVEQESLEISKQRHELAEQLVLATEAQAQGQTELAAELTREAEIRKGAISLQQQAGLSEADALALSERRLIAQERIAAASAATAQQTAHAQRGLGGLTNALTAQEPKWRSVVNHTTTVGRQLIQGNASLASTTSLLGSIAPAWAGIGIAVGAATKAISYFIEKDREATMQSLRSGQAAEARAKQYREWRRQTLEENERDLELETEKLNKMREKVRVANAELGGEGLAAAWQATKMTINDIYKEFAALAPILPEEIFTVKVNPKLIEELEDQEKSLTTLNKRIAEQRKELNETSSQKDVAEQTEVATKAYDRQAQAIQRVSDEIKKVEFEKLTAPERWRILSAEVDNIRRQLRELGVDAKTPEDALAASASMADATKQQVGDLAVAWAETNLRMNRSKEEAARVFQQQREELEKLRNEVEALQAKLPKLQADLADMIADGKNFVQAEVETLGGRKESGWYRESDTGQNASGQIMPNVGASPVAANDSELLRFQQLQSEIAQTEQTLLQRQAAISQSAEATKRSADEVSQSAQQTAEATRSLGDAVTRGNASITAAVAPMAEQINSTANQTVQQLDRLNTTLGHSFSSVLSAVERTNQTLDHVILRLGALERRAMA